MKKLLLLFFTLFTFTSLNSAQLILNGGFIHSASSTLNGWTSTGDFNFNTTFSQWNFDIGYGYTSGANNATGYLYQSVSIPSTTTSATLSLYYKISTNEINFSVPYDICTIKIYEVGNASHSHTFRTLSHIDRNTSYQQLSYTIPTSFIGKNIVLQFKNTNDGARSTTFRFDNVSINTTTSSGGGGSSPDFYIYNQALGATSVQAGNTVYASCRQGYTGTMSSSGNVYMGYYLSTNTTWDSGDTPLYLNDFSSLSPTDQDDPESETLTIPSSTSPGNYHILFKANRNLAFSESNVNNNVSSVPLVVTGIPIPAPTVSILSPNTYMCVPTNTSLQIQTQITGAITGKKLEYSFDDGSTWYQIQLTNTSGTVFNPTWITPSFTTQKYCKFRVTVFSPSGNVSAISSAPILIVPPKTPAILDKFGVSHLFWPFENSTWQNKDKWVNGNDRWVIYSGSHHGQNHHKCADYYSLDYGRTGKWGVYHEDSVCNKKFYAPLDGKIIKISNSDGSCCLPFTCNTNSYGNQIVIQSNQDTNFAFRVAHLNYVKSTLTEGSTVLVGQELGEVGGTGTNGAHAHCSLYKNIHHIQVVSGTPTNMKAYLRIGSTVSNTSLSYCNDFLMYSAEFEFDASPNSGGGSTNIKENELFEEYVNIYPNPNNGDFTIQIDENKSVTNIELYNVAGKKIPLIYSIGNINVKGLSKGMYYVRFQVENKMVTKKVIVS